MIVKARYLSGDTLIGFLVDDGGLEIPVGAKGLYDAAILNGLIESGYTFYDYFNNIKCPDGTDISGIVGLPFTGTELELQMMYDSDEFVLTEADASKYFTRDVCVEAIKLREPKVEIHTREEFINYLEDLKLCVLNSSIAVSMDVRPLNSFVAREALFEMSELCSNTDLCALFHFIAKRREYASYDNYQNMLKWLVNEGVLDSIDAPYEKVIEAYNSWGIDGIKTPIIATNMVYGDQMFDAYCEKPPRDSQIGFYTEIGLMSKSGVIHSVNESVDLSTEDDFKALEVRPQNNDLYFNNLRSIKSWKNEYKAIPICVKTRKNRLRYTLLDKDGARFIVSATAGFIGFYLVQWSEPEQFTSSGGWHIKINDSTIVDIQRLTGQNQIVFHTLATSKAKELIQARIVKPIYDNSFQMVVANGLTAYCAIRYLSYLEEKRKGDSSDEDMKKIPFKYAANKYKQGPDDSDESVFNPEGIAYADFDSLIDGYLEAKDRLVAEGIYYNPKELESEGATFATGEIASKVGAIAMRTPDLLEFARSILEGEVSTGEYADAKRYEESSSIESLVSFYRVMATLEKGKNFINSASYDELVDFIRKVETEYDIDEIIPTRDRAYYGMLQDIADLLGWKARQSLRFGYVERVFREVSNEPAKNQRHAFASISYMENGPVLQKLVTEVSALIYQAYRAQLFVSEKFRTIAETIIPYLATEIIWKIRRLPKMLSASKAGGYVIADKLFEYLDAAPFEIPAETVLRINKEVKVISEYAALSELVNNEFSDNNGLVYGLTIFNATISPWHIYAKKGWNLKSYPLGPNYYITDTIAKFAGEEFVKTESFKAAKVANMINDFEGNFYGYDTLPENWLFNKQKRGKLVLTDDTVDNTHTIAENSERIFGSPIDLASMYDYRTDDPEDMMTRFLFKAKKVKGTDRYLKRMESTSDTEFANFFNCYGLRENDGDTYGLISEDGIMSGNWLKDTTVLPLDYVGSISTVKSLEDSKFKRVNFTKMSFEDLVKFKPVLTEDFKQYGYIRINGGNVTFTAKSVITKNVNELTREFLDKLVEKNFICKINQSTYFFRTVAGDYSLEV